MQFRRLEGIRDSRIGMNSLYLSLTTHTNIKILLDSRNGTQSCFGNGSQPISETRIPLPKAAILSTDTTETACGRQQHRTSRHTPGPL